VQHHYLTLERRGLYGAGTLRCNKFYLRTNRRVEGGRGEGWKGSWEEKGGREGSRSRVRMGKRQDGVGRSREFFLLYDHLGQ